jgi:putative DNA primase/helicase
LFGSVMGTTSAANNQLPCVDADAFRAMLGSPFDLIPLKAGSKQPLHANWTTRRYGQRKVVSYCIKHNANMGIRLRPDQLAVDVDVRHGGEEGLANLAKEFGFDPIDFPRQITGADGSHLIMTKPADLVVRDTLKDERFRGCEFKGAGRQIVCAGSVHPETGRHYRWDAFPHPTYSEGLPPAPKTLLTAIERPKHTVTEGNGRDYSAEQIERMLNSMPVENFREHDKWLTLAMSVHAASGGTAVEEFVAWSVGDPAYADDGEKIRERWESFDATKAEGITSATLLKFVREEGDPNTMPPGDVGDDFDGEEIPQIVDDDDDNDEPEDPNSKTKTAKGLRYDIAADIEPEPIDWLWPNRFPVGKMSMLAGFPDQGKTQIALHVAAVVSRGGEWPNREGKAEQGAVIILSAEDDAADTLVPRLKAAGADMNQIIFVRSTVRVDSVNRVFNLADDLKRLTAVIEQERTNGRNVRLLIIDPISAYMGGGKSKADTFKNTEVRALLTPLGEWLTRHRLASILISHFNKGGSGKALYRVTDSLAFTAAARIAWLTAEEPETGRKLMLKGKSNLGPDPGGLAYKIEGVDIGNGINAPRIVWDGRVTVTADEALASDGKKAKPIDRAEMFLGMLLASGPVSHSEIEQQAKEAGHAWITVKRAKHQLGVCSRREGPSWVWYLPESDEDGHFD